MIQNIGFISTRIAGTDGVSFEIKKWVHILEKNGYQCYFFGGEVDKPANKSFIEDRAHFKHLDILKIQNNSFGVTHRSKEMSFTIQKIKNHLKSRLHEFISKFNLDLIILENVLTIPMNIPLGLAITELIAETCLPAIAHHHDFRWERDRYMINAVEDYLSVAFPPVLESIKHVNINSIAQEQLNYRKGISSIVIPNVLDFSNPPYHNNNHWKSLRKQIGLREEDLFILQPSRIVPRKCIERSIELVSMMNLSKLYLIISHSASDEGDEYAKRIYKYAENLGVNIIEIEHIICENNVENKDKRFYSMGDVYKCADLITYPSSYEGFGNAFLEAVYLRKPIIMNRYPVYIKDIEPKGFDVLTIDSFVTKDVVEKVKLLLDDKERKNAMVDNNYEIAKNHFSFELLERDLIGLIQSF